MKNENNKKFNSSVFIYMFLSVLCGMLGAFIIFIYFFNWMNANLILENINLEGNLKNIVFQKQQKVIVTQDKAYNEVFNDSKYSIVDIYKKEEKNKNLKSSDAEAAQYGKFIGKGVILTTDGWIVTASDEFYKNNSPAGDDGPHPQGGQLPLPAQAGLSKKETAKDNPGENPKDNFTDYLIIVNDGKDYNPEKIIKDDYNKTVFLKINANGLAVLPSASTEEILEPQSVITLGRENMVDVKHISKVNYSKLIVEDAGCSSSADSLGRWILIDDEADKNYLSSPVINLKGELAGIINSSNTAILISSIEKSFKSIIKTQEIIRPSLAIEYINLSNLLNFKAKKGALVREVLFGGAAEKAGIKKGDIILKVEDREVKENNLPELIQEYEKGTSVNFTILRDEKELVMTVKL